MKVLAIALALCFAAAPVQAAAKNKAKHHSAKRIKKGRPHGKGAKASRIKRANHKVN